MKREEAIKWLKTFKGNTGMTELSQAFDVAIAALEELPKRRKEAKRWKTKAAQIIDKYKAESEEQA